MKISFTLFVIALLSSNLFAAQVAEFDTKLEVVSCFEKKGCTGVDDNEKNITHQVVFKKVTGKNEEPRFQATIEVSQKKQGENYKAYVNILRHRMKENWIYTITVYLKDSAERATIIRTRDLAKLSAVVLKAKPRKKNKKTINATFYFGPARTDMF